MNETLRLLFEIALAGAIAGLLAWALRLRRQVATDPLTGLASRRAWDDALRRARGPRCVAILDLDWFKRVNDERGHEIGDRVLERVGQALRATLPAGGFVARLGGDEFGVLLDPATASDAALDTVRRASTATLSAAGLPALTASIGAARGPTATAEQAGQALLKAKQAGRDRLIVAA